MRSVNLPLDGVLAQEILYLTDVWARRSFFSGRNILVVNEVDHLWKPQIFSGVAP